jgi:hypothetical protein
MVFMCLETQSTKLDASASAIFNNLQLLGFLETIIEEINLLPCPVTPGLMESRTSMKYLQIVATCILAVLCVIAYEVMPAHIPTRSDLEQAKSGSDGNAIKRFYSSLPVVSVFAVDRPVAVQADTLDVKVTNTVEVENPSFRSGGKLNVIPMQVEIMRP